MANIRLSCCASFLCSSHGAKEATWKSIDDVAVCDEEMYSKTRSIKCLTSLWLGSERVINQWRMWRRKCKRHRTCCQSHRIRMIEKKCFFTVRLCSVCWIVWHFFFSGSFKPTCLSFMHIHFFCWNWEMCSGQWGLIRTMMIVLTRCYHSHSLHQKLWHWRWSNSSFCCLRKHSQTNFQLVFSWKRTSMRYPRHILPKSKY